jgi:hypothetical protein
MKRLWAPRKTYTGGGRMKSICPPPPQDKRGRGQEKEKVDNDMEISHPVEEKRKRPRNTEKTEAVIKKKIKDT